ncbi:proline iminopeptidase-family hydrolase [Streptomyces lancefieldiae]|uniref:Proline iminopeptidase n=1 Tax=Streptomyces lancefieldiae TaxID=3075520 RepID=A0ABU3B0E6_9ACTN|nr:proline iminopeptidase-family hydrolase [Streptomyces sp. DSM 40712]MDT0615648.1 proline iminopeptidase-family hydrolase [Streptomyces sp. DSM 40712]
MAVAPSAEGWAPFRGHRTWYRVTGRPDGGRPPVVVVHGGPGSTHDYLLRLAALAEDGWPVVHYDQLGNGASTHLRDAGADFWTVGLFRAELDNLLRHLGIQDRYVLVGHSWGGLLSAAHAADRPEGLRGLVIADSPASYPLWRQEMEVLRAALPRGVDRILRAHERAGTVDSPAYVAAVRVFNDRHVCRVRPWPPEYVATVMEIANNPTVYRTMNGPSEFHVVGTLRDWSVEDVLPDITVPTLVLSGRHDEATEVTVRPFQERIPDVRWEVLEESSHMPHLEEPERFHALLVEFLKGLDA